MCYDLVDTVWIAADSQIVRWDAKVIFFFFLHCFFFNLLLFFNPHILFDTHTTDPQKGKHTYSTHQTGSPFGGDTRPYEL
jgi:hypothetical protein